ncbi:GNAT family N-acetyltransferase [Olivibacter domesticus]|uniref:Putative acetyltransferase n=1 Tax=Olivibacter domesticus TaxID=407022 RepID=A0A1H7Z7M4_OLID1|nr:GNAT family N-acetyltransferase [Olivibacter domesticus]SEM53489.1 putative acetyltransferase [Olivibacter domesticus]
MSIIIRVIKDTDNVALAKILRNSLDEFNVPQEGTVYTDPTTDNLYALFKPSNSIYYVAEEDGVILGGCGVYPTEGLPKKCAELVKFYLSNQSRGKGIGKMMLEKCFTAAAALGYTHLYLESFPQFEKAVSMYEKAGFEMLSGPLGNSGHFACTIWMLKKLNQDTKSDAPF